MPDHRPNVFPFLRYEDAPAAVEWLCAAFGFEKRLVLPNDDGTIAHAELGLGPGVVMLGSTHGQDPLELRSPRSLGGMTQGIYIAVDDVDAHYERARAAGAEIVRVPEDQDYGSREYAARDPEGHIWTFGTYRPGAEGT
ncbi:MAG: VOC family protein [Actinomycetota bacterium]|nr:VOC family protein [Actinomycetota bacterium]